MSEKKPGRKLPFNVVDVIILVIVAAALFFGVRKLQSSGMMDQKTAYHITYTVLCEEQPVELYENLLPYIPGQVMASGEMYDATILSVERQPWLVCSDGQWVEDPRHENLIFTMEATLREGSVRTNSLGKQELRVGRSDYIVKTEDIEISKGIITSIQWDTRP